MAAHTLVKLTHFLPSFHFQSWGMMVFALELLNCSQISASGIEEWYWRPWPEYREGFLEDHDLEAQI